MDGGPWYDFARIHIQEDRNGEVAEADYAAEIQAFVDLESKTTGEVEMLALVKFHASALTYHESADPTNPWKDLSKVCRHLPLPLVCEDPDTNARYGLVDTEQIKHGLWVQRDFQTPDRLWVLTKGFYDQ